MTTLPPNHVSNSRQSNQIYDGQVVYLFAFDLAYDMVNQPIISLCGCPVGEFSIGPSKRSPRQMFLYAPKTAELPPLRRQLATGTVEVRRSVKIFEVGAISIKLRLPFTGLRLDELIKYHGLEFTQGNILQDALELAEKVRVELEPYCIRPVPKLSLMEEYTVFCLDCLPAEEPVSPCWSENWFLANRRQIAGLLTEEHNTASLSEQETVESTQQYLSYYHSDMVVVDWDAALIAGEKEGLEDILHIMELANVQMVELEAYDRILDQAIEVSYRDLARLMPISHKIRRNLREIRIDLTRFSDELMNTTKFFGDWHLARIYANCSGRFHLPDWHHAVEEKLKSLGGLYELIQQDRVNLWMVILEASIVLFCMIDIALLIWKI